MFKMISFDMDWTLTPSRDIIQPDMKKLFKKLLLKYKVWIISWGWFNQFKKQILDHIWNNKKLLKNLYLCPTCATKMYLYKNNWFEEIYSMNLSIEEKNYIKNTLKIAINELKLEPEKIWWETIDDRDTQISYIILWIDAPNSVKYVWDTDFSKRKAIIEKIKNKFENFDLLAAWTTTIDIIRKWVNKAFWIKKLSEISWISLNEIIFVWDAIFPWWNDYAPFEIWITCKRVFNLEDTKEYIKTLIN